MDGETKITDLFSGCEAFKKLSLLINPTELEELTFNQIKEIILKKLIQVLVIKTKMLGTHSEILSPVTRHQQILGISKFRTKKNVFWREIY